MDYRTHSLTAPTGLVGVAATVLGTRNRIHRGSRILDV